MGVGKSVDCFVNEMWVGKSVEDLSFSKMRVGRSIEFLLIFHKQYSVEN